MTIETATLQNIITKEAFWVMGLAEYPRLSKLIEPLFRPLIGRFARLATDFENDVAANGLTQAVDRLLESFVDVVDIKYEAPLPAEGPLLITANHPGAYDFLLLAAATRRDDLKIMASNVNIVRHLPALSEHFIFISQGTVLGDAHSRMASVREALRHLKVGGALLVFPSGRVDPDPALAPEAAIDELSLWSPSTALFLRRAPQTLTTIGLVSGVLSPAWYHSPVTWFRRQRHYKQKMAQVFQVMQQLIFPRSLKVSPVLHFSRSMSVDNLRSLNEEGALLPALIGEAERLLSD
jgi:hypothetical protein